MNTLAACAYLAVEKHFKKVQKHEPGVLENKDIEELHQMRVGMRRLRSTIDGFALVLQLPKAANTAKVAKVARVLGKQRDQDVMSQALQALIPQVPQEESAHLEYALKILSRQRKKSSKLVKTDLTAGEYLNLKEAFIDWLKQPCYSDIGHLEISSILPDLLLPQLSRFFLYPTWYLPEGNLDDLAYLSQYGESFHDLRKEAKKLRYNLELFSDLGSESYQYYLGKVSNIQTMLGDIQDSFVLRDFLADVFDEELSIITPTLDELLQKNRLEKWEQWQTEKAQFLSPQFKKEFYSSCLSLS